MVNQMGKIFKLRICDNLPYLNSDDIKSLYNSKSVYRWYVLKEDNAGFQVWK